MKVATIFEQDNLTTTQRFKIKAGLKLFSSNSDDGSIPTNNSKSKYHMTKNTGKLLKVLNVSNSGVRHKVV